MGSRGGVRNEPGGRLGAAHPGRGCKSPEVSVPWESVSAVYEMSDRNPSTDKQLPQGHFSYVKHDRIKLY